MDKEYKKSTEKEIKLLLKHMKIYLVSLVRNINKKNKEIGWVQWLRPIILALEEAKAGRSLEVRSSRPSWSTW